MGCADALEKQCHACSDGGKRARHVYAFLLRTRVGLTDLLVLTGTTNLKEGETRNKL